MDIVIRATVAFLFIFLLTRVVGRRELASLEPFDLIMLVVLGDLVQQGVTQNDFSVTGLILAAGTIAALTVFVSWASWRFAQLRPVLDVALDQLSVLHEDDRAQHRAKPDHT